MALSPLPLLLLLLLLTWLQPNSAILRRPKSISSQVPEESWMNTPQLIAKWGYPAETHLVQTDDGYILEVHRIPGPKGSGGKGYRGPAMSSAAAWESKGPRPPVLLMHGFGSTSECMVLREHKTLAFMLVNAGFDVWLGNFRGTYYGRRHVSMTTADSRFWDFSWHENGIHDVAGMVDYIIKVTGERSVLFASHSMGGTALMALLADRPQYNAKIRAIFMLSPAVYFHHVRGIFKLARERMRWSYTPLSPLRMELLPLRRPTPEMCLTGPNTMTVSPSCVRFFTDLQGPFRVAKNNTWLPILLRHWPGGTSTGQMIHFGQLIIRGDGFFHYDYGLEKNLVKYGSIYPPAYNLTNVVSPTFIFYCKNDYQAHYKDVRKLAADIPGLAGLYLADAEYLNHLDIMYDEKAADLVYERLIEQMNKYK